MVQEKEGVERGELYTIQGETVRRVASILFECRYARGHAHILAKSSLDDEGNCPEHGIKAKPVAITDDDHIPPDAEEAMREHFKYK